MFQRARLKLTAWYLLIIMLISILFSLAIYITMNRELERVERFQKLRQEERRSLIPALEQFRKEREELGMPLPPIPRNFNLPEPEIVSEVRVRLVMILTLVNLGILVFSGVCGYLLAGLTLRPIKDMLDEQNRFIADASHELRTPLTSLKSEIEVALRDKNLTLTDAKKQLASNLEDVNILQTLSDNLIKLTQYQKSGGNLIFERNSLRSAIDEACKKVSKLAKQKNIKIRNNVSDHILEMDKNALTELFVILLDNAIKYNPKGTEVYISAKKADSQIVIEFRDNGVGIKKEDLPFLFNRFYRSDKSRTKLKVSGFGLGLAIAKEIVEKHKGSINVESEEGKGTAFIIKLFLRIPK